MARQGNFVTIPGGGVNFTRDLSSTLAGLAESFGKRAALEEDRRLREAATAESARRYELDRDRQLSRDSILDARQKERDRIADERFAARNALETEERNRVKRGREAVANFARTYDRSELNRELLRNDPHLRQLTTRKQIQNQENLARNVLIDVWKSQGRDLITSDVPTGVDAINALQTEYANFRKNGGSERLSGIFDNYAQEMADLSQKTENFVLSEAPIYRGVRQRAILQDLLTKDVDEKTASAIARDFTDGDITRDFAERNALASARLQQQAHEKAATTAYRLASLGYKENQKNAPKIDKSVSSTVSAHKTLEEVDPGWFDKGTMATYIEDARKAGLSPVYINEAVKRAISVDPMAFGLFTTRDINVKDSDAFQSLVNTVKVEQEAGKALDRDLLTKITAEPPATKDATTAAREAFFGGIAQLSPDLTRLPNSRPPDLSGNTENSSSQAAAEEPLVDRSVLSDQGNTAGNISLAAELISNTNLSNTSTAEKEKILDFIGDIETPKNKAERDLLNSLNTQVKEVEASVKADKQALKEQKFLDRKIDYNKEQLDSTPFENMDLEDRERLINDLQVATDFTPSTKEERDTRDRQLKVLRQVQGVDGSFAARRARYLQRRDSGIDNRGSLFRYPGDNRPQVPLRDQLSPPTQRRGTVEEQQELAAIELALDQEDRYIKTPAHRRAVLERMNQLLDKGVVPRTSRNALEQRRNLTAALRTVLDRTG